MKRLLLTFAIILQGMTLAQSYAQSHTVNNTDGTEILKFKNIPIKGNIKEFDLKMRDKNGPLEKVCGYRSTIKILFCPFIKLNNG